VLISGTLGLPASPLAALFREVWRQVGGEDRGRSHPDQLRIAAAFGPMIQFVEQGRMADISRLFATLNVALGDLDADVDVGRQRVMDVQARAASVAALTQAPRLVVQIVEDVLAQTVAAQGGLGRPRAALAWERELGGACRAAIAGAYPFGAGPDADFAAVAELLAPDGRLTRFFGEQLAPLMDVEQSPWRWKPEARLSGFTNESAAFFERAAAVGDALFPPEGVALTLTALAQRGAATVSLGGVPVPVTTAGDPAALVWPGPAPAQGFQIAFATAAGDEREAWPGPWGLLRFLDGLRLRARDDGQRYLLDVSLPTSRAYLELAFNRAANPAAVRGPLADLACPPTL
jgi:type VI protein secretion system component VasK